MKNKGTLELDQLGATLNFRHDFEICNYIMERYINGDFKRAHALFDDLKITAKDEFIDYFVDFYNYVPQDTEELEGDMTPREPQDSMYKFFVNLM